MQGYEVGPSLAISPAPQLKAHLHAESMREASYSLQNVSLRVFAAGNPCEHDSALSAATNMQIVTEKVIGQQPLQLKED
jgi:hypothetical protein